MSGPGGETPRKWAWRDAVKASDLHPHARLIALVIADYWRTEDDRPSLWVDYARVGQETGLSRRSVYKFMDTLREQGWLTMTAKAVQHSSPRYMPTFPKVATVATNPGDATPLRGARGAPLNDPEVRVAHSEVRVAHPIHKERKNHHHQPSAARAPDGTGPDLVVVEELDQALRKGLPAPLAAKVTSTAALRASLNRLAGLGWTAGGLADAAAGRDWTGARPGAVQSWLRDLDTPPRVVQVRVPGWCGDCRSGWLGEDEEGRPAPCLVCRPHAAG